MPVGCEGRIAGATLRAVRETLGLTQEDLAETLDADRNTVKGWETGRRPLGARSHRKVISLERALRRLGAPADLVRALDVAADADWLLGHLLTLEVVDPADHPLAGAVTTRDLSEMLAWPLTGRTPPPLGTGHRAPVLAADERNLLLDSLRRAAEASLVRRRTGDDSGPLLRRQAAYFAGTWGHPDDGWLRELERVERQRAGRLDRWSPSWVSLRSIAVAHSIHGDPEPLRAFIAEGLASDAVDRANLNYWAYWTGETPYADHATDLFMVDPEGDQWRGTGLLRRLVAALDRTTPYLDLCVHSVWALVRQRAHILADDGALTTALREKCMTLAAREDLLSPQSCRELGEIFAALRPVRLVGVA